MITSSNFFKKTFFPSEDNVQESPKHKEKSIVGPWQQVTDLSNLIKYDVIRKRNRSSINQYNPYNHRERKEKLLQKKFQRQVPLLQSKPFKSIDYDLIPKTSPPIKQKINNQKLQTIHLPNISIKQYADIFNRNQTTLSQFEMALLKIPEYKLKNSKFPDDLNFIRRNSIKKQNNIRSRAESRQQLIQNCKKTKRQNKTSEDMNSKFMAYQKHLKASKKNRYYQGIAIHPINYEIQGNFSSLT